MLRTPKAIAKSIRSFDMKPSIRTYDLNHENVNKIGKEPYGKNWPVVYILNNHKEAYIGETISASSRTKQHLENEERRRLTEISIIADKRFNKSAALDIESKLIEHMSADGKYVLQNSNNGMRDHAYYEKEMYESLFREIWKELKVKNIVKHDLDILENSELFKYSPFKRLTEEQYSVIFELALDLIVSIQLGEPLTVVMNGEAGTGKTVLAMFMMKLFADNKLIDFIAEEDEGKLLQFQLAQDRLKEFKFALVVPMTSLRKTLKGVVKEIKGLKSSMVIGPNDVFKDDYDLLIVDEAHRLMRRKNLPNFGSYDSANRKHGLDKEATQLDWIMKRSKYQILFYDAEQSIKPSDIRPEDFKELKTLGNYNTYSLTSQLRVKGGEDYLRYIKDILNVKPKLKRLDFENYEFKLFNDIEEMKNSIFEKEKLYGLSRLVAGYSWPWKTKGIKYEEAIIRGIYDIEIDGKKFIWNNTASGWVNSPNAINEVGSIHTIQGYDLNYAGVIIGPELTYNEKIKKIEVIKENYYDTNGKRSILDDQELEDYIVNIYSVLLSRAISGTYVYVCDPKLRKYIAQFVGIE